MSALVDKFNIFKPAKLDKETATASQLMLHKFRSNRLAWISFWFLMVAYIVAMPFAEFFAPFESGDSWRRYTFAPPQEMHLIEKTDNGYQWAPHLSVYDVKTDPMTLQKSYELNEDKKAYFEFFGQTDEYHLMGFIPMTTKFIVPEDKSMPFFWLGSDRMGRDMLSRVIHGARISLSVGLMGVFFSLVIGITVGAIAGLRGGWFDIVTNRIMEVIKAIPTLPLWMALTASLPREWDSITKYFLVTLILGCVTWPDMAREVRSRFMSLRNEEFINAAWLDGNSQSSIIRRYMVPNFMGHIIAAVTLAIPAMILGETSLSFLGLGLQAPVVSWGVLLQEAQNIRSVAEAPWLLYPAGMVVVVILAMNSLGDGLRDATDPYHEA